MAKTEDNAKTMRKEMRQILNHAPEAFKSDLGGGCG
jgi:hypothetical protein